MSLTLSPSGTFFGSVSVTTVSGIATFTGLRVLTAGTLEIVASSNSISDVFSEGISIENYPFIISLDASSSTPSAFHIFQITATIKGEDNNLFTGICIVTITETSSATIYGDTTMTSTTGTVVFNSYFGSDGSKTISAACSTISQSVTITVLKQQLKIISITPTVKNI